MKIRTLVVAGALALLGVAAVGYRLGAGTWPTLGTGSRHAYLACALPRTETMPVSSRMAWRSCSVIGETPCMQSRLTSMTILTRRWAPLHSYRPIATTKPMLAASTTCPPKSLVTLGRRATGCIART